MNKKYLVMLGAGLITLISLLSGTAYADRESHQNRSVHHNRVSHQDRDFRQDRRARQNRELHRDRDFRQDRRARQSRELHRDRDFRQDRRAHWNRAFRQEKRFDRVHVYLRRGHAVRHLPARYYTVPFRNTHYYFSAGIWYRPYGLRYVVVQPPRGVTISVLPDFYTTVWFSGVPYYYANNVYYVRRPDRNGYEVTDPPEAVSEQTTSAPSDELYIYPKRGQSKKKQANDRYACHQWGVTQTSYNPATPPENLPVNTIKQKRKDYFRAMRACLEGRGYSVR